MTFVDEVTTVEARGYNILIFSCVELATRWRSWLSPKVAGSIPDGVIGIFNTFNHSGRTFVMLSTHPLTEMSTKDISWGVKAAGV